MLGVTGTASATTPHNYDNATAFLNNITQLENNSVVTINCSQANVSQNYTINASNITIKAINGQVTFQSNTSNIHFIVNGNNVTLQGIKFQNFNSPNLNGGTILWNGDNGTITNCNLNNNTAMFGGAIYLNANKKRWNMSQCNFTQNTVNGAGGAIYVNFNVDSWVMTNCTFKENTAKNDGGAIYVLNTVNSWNMSQCNFCENNAASGAGGAIYVQSVGSWNMSQCNFCENNATSVGGAIYVSSNVDSWVMTNCTFNNNTVSSEVGGAICVQSVGSWNMSQCNFCENNATGAGGAIYVQFMDSWNMTDCTFTNNVATAYSKDGGAIYAYSVGSWVMTNCTFKDNKVKFNGGGAIYAYSVGSWNMSQCNFCENNAIFGSAIYASSGVTWTMTNCTFKENTAKNGGGAAIYVFSGVTTWIMTNCTFKENNATDGGTIYVYEEVTTWIMTNCTFKENNATGAGGGAIYVKHNVITWNMTDCTFISNSAASGAGGAINLNPSTEEKINSWNMNNCTFKLNTAKYGGAIYVEPTVGINVDSWNMNNCAFTSNNANTIDGAGGAIHAGLIGSWNMNNCTFTSNNANNSGGAINVDSIAIWDMSNCTFKDNNARFNSGAIYAQTTVQSWNMSNCTFKENNASSGGAIYVNTVNSWNMSQCNFCENNAASGAGGAIYVSSNVDSWNMTDCTFCENKDQYGVDIYNLGTITLIGDSKAIIYNGGTITNTLTAIILGNGTVGVAENEDFNLTAFIKVGNYTIIGSQDFNFTINNDNLTATLTGDHYRANYHVSGTIGHIISVNGSYAYTGSAVNYQTGNLLIKNCVNLTGDNITLPFNNKIEVKLNATISNGTLVENGTVSITINEKTYTGEVSNGKVIVEIGDKLDVGVYYLTAVYLENQDYLNATFDFILNITKANVNFTIDNVSYSDGKIVISTNTTINGNITVTINDETKIVPIVNGTADLNISDWGLSAGNYTALLNFTGNDNYTSIIEEINFTIAKGNATFNIDNITYGDDELIINTNGGSEEGNITVTIDGITKVIPIINGTANLNITEWNLPPGNYSATIKYPGDKNYNSTITVINFTIKKDITIIHIDVTETSSDNVLIHLNLTDVKGKPITGNVTVNITSDNGYERLEVVSLVNGVGSLELTQLNDGIYNVTATYNATVDYESSFNSSSFIINNTEIEYYLNASDVVKYYKNGTHYTVKLTDNHGNPVAGQTILVTLSSSRWAKPVSYNITTNASGVATLDINLIAGEYSIIATFGNATPEINNITVLEVNFVLTADNVVKYFKNSTNYTVTVNSQFGYVIPNEAVTVKIYSENWLKPVTYTIKTNESGVAALPINLISGIYSISATIGKTAKSNNIAVLPTLTAESITKTVKQSGSLKARLVDGQGNPISGKEVKFTVKTKTYTFTTDSDGIATLPIHLGLGTWSFLIANPDTGASTRATVKVIK